MAVEGVHDSNIYITTDESVTTFDLSGSSTSSANQTYTVVTYTDSLAIWRAPDNSFVFGSTWQYRREGGSIFFDLITNDGNTNFNITLLTDQPFIMFPWHITPEYDQGPDAGNVIYSNFVLSSDLTKLKSIQNVSISQNVQEDASLVVGKDLSSTQINGPTQTTVSVDKILNNQDAISRATYSKNGVLRKSSISGQFEYGDNILAFNKACLDNFSVSATINDLPQASFDFTIYGSMSGSNTSVPPANQNEEQSLQEIKAEGLIVTFDKGATNAVQSFNYSEIYNKQAIYGIGSNEPEDIKFIGPVQQEASISIEVEDYETEETFSFLSGSKDRNRTIKLEISGDSSILNKFELENAYLVNESIGAGIGNTIVANLTYRGYKKV